MASAWSGRATGSPPATMYSSPMVLIFSNSYSSASWSNSEKISLSRLTKSPGASFDAKGVKSTMSAKRIVASAIAEAMGADALRSISKDCVPWADGNHRDCFNCSTIGLGRILRSNCSDFCCSARSASSACLRWVMSSETPSTPMGRPSASKIGNLLTSNHIGSLVSSRNFCSI